MRIAIIGGGTSGFMAATHLSKRHPEVDLLHVFDSSMPTIGVGEGTTPGFRKWLASTAPTTTEELRDGCYATFKHGIQFENWGRTHRIYRHDFVPRAEPALHISAERITSFLEQFIDAEVVDAQVVSLDTANGAIVLETHTGRNLTADLVVDARGFPRKLTADHERLTWIPTNAALVTREPIARTMERTRAVARPHGWIFVIPLTAYTSYGYVYSEQHATVGEAEEDFRSFLREEGAEALDLRRIGFPNFVCRELFDGAIFKIGNAASFVEPLEATLRSSRSS